MCKLLSWSSNFCWKVFILQIFMLCHKHQNGINYYRDWRYILQTCKFPIQAKFQGFPIYMVALSTYQCILKSSFYLRTKLYTWNQYKIILKVNFIWNLKQKSLYSQNTRSKSADLWILTISKTSSMSKPVFYH